VPEDRSVLDRRGPDPAATWAYGAGRDEVADLYPIADGAPAGRPVVMLVHGGFWRPDYDRRHLRPMAGALSASGFPTVLIEYARRPGSPDASVDDVRAAVGAVRGRLDTSAGLVVAGHSAGGHLALLVAGERGVTGCLALAPVADLVMAEALGLDGDAVPAFLGRPAADRPDLDPVRRPSSGTATTLVHGDEDAIVPMALSASYCLDGRARLVVERGCAHFELIDPLSAAWPAVMVELAALAEPSGIE
jgi:acetyl esterase/lipase